MKIIVLLLMMMVLLLPLLMMMVLLFAVNLRWLPVSGMFAIYGGGDLPDISRFDDFLICVQE